MNEESSKSAAANTLDYARRETKPRSNYLNRIILIVGIPIFGFLFYSLLKPSLGRSPETANRMRCASHLRQLGEAILFHAKDNQDYCPADLAELLISEQVVAEILICPSSNDNASCSGATTQQIVDDIRSKAGHLSYIYLGNGKLYSRLTPDEVLAYEPLSNHQNAGMNVLFGDGHVEFMDLRQSRRIISEVSAGYNPPRKEMLR